MPHNLLPIFTVTISCFNMVVCTCACVCADAKLMFWSGYRGIADFAHGVTQLHAAVSGLLDSL